MTVHIEERTPLAAQANLDPLARILNYKSPEYSIAAGHSPNSSTRPPKLFDMHLHKDLRLKKIEILNDLPRIISEVCNDYIKPNSGIPLYAVNHYSRSWADSKKAKISNEEDLVNAYSNLVPTFQRAASFLRFRTPWRNPALLWSATPSVFYPGRKEAVADGFLSTPASFDGLPAALREEMELLDKYCLNHFGVWEFKSLVCGPKIMSAIPKLEGDFLWTTCQERIDSNHRSHSCTSAVTSHRVDGRPIVSGRRAGPDADGDTVLKKASNCTQALHSKRKIGESDDEQVALDDKRKRTQERDLTAEKCARLMQENAVIVSDFKKLTEDERYRVCGHDIAQQAWTQAVVDDATFIIFSSGNIQIIGIRDRQSQTLFLSPPINISTADNPPFTKLQVGLFIAAYNDALNRAVQLRAMEATGWLLNVPFRYKLWIDRSPPLNPVEGLILDTRPKPDDEAILADLELCSRISLLLHDRSPCIDHRRRDRWDLVRKYLNPTSNAGATLGNRWLYLDYGVYTTEKVFTAYLTRVNPDSHEISHFTSPLVIKMAVSEDDKRRLNKEEAKYRGLRSKDANVVKTYGMFSSTVRGHERRTFLLMEYGGVTLNDRNTSGMRLNGHVKQNCDDYLAAVMSFHAAGWIHNNLTERHILFDVRTEKAVMISLSKCKVFQSVECAKFTKKQGQDLKQLYRCLGDVKDIDWASVGKLDSATGGYTELRTQEQLDSANDQVPLRQDWDIDRWEQEDGVWYPTPTPEGSQTSDWGL